jgi:ABC-type nickel/cobalt efflux system permease component RcnA
VLSGFAVFLVLRLLIGQLPSISGRPSPTFLMIGYALIIISGLVMLIQSLRPAQTAHDGVHALTAGIGLLPCPLTISVLGFAWAQGSALVLLSLALGISTTIGIVAVLAIGARSILGTALVHWLPQIERSSLVLQRLAAVAIIAIGALTIIALGA